MAGIDEKADLHIHSIYSDGNFSPEKIIKIADEAGLKAISITDHDNLESIDHIQKIDREYAVEIVPGVEISARHDNYELHILGYFFDYQDEELNRYIDYFKDERKIRAQKIIKNLNRTGINIKYEAILEKAFPGSIGRPHIANVMVEQGFTSNYQEAFQYFIGDTCSCNVLKVKISPKDAIKLITNAGGLSFLAHPGVDFIEDRIAELVGLGLTGIEIYHPRHNKFQVSFLKTLSEKFNLLECGGSDCHGVKFENEETKIGKYTIPYDWVMEMKNRL